MFRRKLVKALISCEDYQTGVDFHSREISRESQNKSQKIGQSCTFVQLTNKRTTVKRDIKKNSVKNPLKAEEDREKPGFAD